MTDGFGPSGESRTHGLLNPIQARYQTALHPDVWPGVLTGDAVYYSASLDRCQLFFQRIFKKFNAFDFSLFSPVVGLNPSAALPEHSKRGSLAAGSFCVYAID